MMTKKKTGPTSLNGMTLSSNVRSGHHARKHFVQINQNKMHQGCTIDNKNEKSDKNKWS